MTHAINATSFLLVLCLMVAGCTSSEQQAKYDQDKHNCVSKKRSAVPTFFEQYDIDDPNVHVANMKASFLEAKDALARAEDTPAGRGYRCSDMVSRISLTKYVPERSPSELRAEAERQNAIIDAAQDEVLADYKRKAKKHYTSVAGAGIRVDVYEMKDGSIHTCKTSVTNGGKAVDCN